MQRRTGVPGTDLTALTANSSVRRAVKATIKRRPPSGGRVLLQAYRLQLRQVGTERLGLAEESDPFLFARLGLGLGLRRQLQHRCRLAFA